VKKKHFNMVYLSILLIFAMFYLSLNKK